MHMPDLPWETHTIIVTNPAIGYEHCKPLDNWVLQGGNMTAIRTSTCDMSNDPLKKPNDSVFRKSSAVGALQLVRGG